MLKGDEKIQWKPSYIDLVAVLFYNAVTIASLVGYIGLS
jgi:hypothetical protein